MMLALPGRQLIQRWEKCRLESYQDDRGIWTIGWGHTGPEVGPGLAWTQAQADATFLKDTSTAQWAVNRAIKAPMTQNQFDALCSLCFNIGVTAFGCSTLVRMFNSGDLIGVRGQFLLWDHTNHQVDPGLENRRESELALFNLVPAPVTPTPQAA